MIQTRKIALFGAAAFICANIGLSQSTDILFKSGSYTLESSVNDFKVNASNQEIDAGHAYRILTFSSIPSSEEKKNLKLAGVELLNYIPRNSFYAKLGLSVDVSALNKKITGVHHIKEEYKLSSNLLVDYIPDWSRVKGNVILDGAYFETIPEENITEILISNGVENINNIGSGFVRFEIEESKLANLYSLPSFYYFDAISKPGEPENDDGRSDHRSNFLAADHNSGLNYDASGVTILMQDDGYIGPHIDFKNRINQDDCECSWSLNETHGDHVAGTIMGAGNLDPKTKGMAYGADLLVYDYEYSTYNMSSIQNHYENDGLVITSTSYSDGCNDGYSNLASQLDEQVRIFPSLIHVFSAGNSGTSDCGYGPTGWGNITGGHKSGKNLMTVGNLTTYDVIAGSSSRGPAEDGRIKPDICGVGSSVYSTAPENTYSTKTGTSMSCPGVAGTLGQLYEAYRDMNGGETPNSGLIKATVLNTGEDLGNPGPDFIYGWGRINARRAYKILEQNNYINDSISQGENESFFINVPNGTKEVRIMLYWTDYEGSPSAGIALVNDLNLLVKDPNTTTFEPWVLDESPNLASLSADAVQGVDDLNNMEQVTILDPEVGSYELNIDGFAIPEGPQEYFIVYEFVQDEIVVTYPNGGEGFESGPNYVVRWDASPSNEDFTLDYTLDDGATWTNIATVDANLRHHSWYTPSPVASGLARLRVTRGAVSDMSDTTFTVMDSPLNLEVEWACPDSLKLTWDNLTDATGYQASMLGNKYMDSMGTNSINSFVYQIPSTDTAWLAVRGLGANNARTERTIAIQKLPGQFGCVWSDPIADLSTMCDSSALDACIDVSNESANVDGSSTYMWYFPGGTPATSTDENPTVCYSTIGYHDAALVVTNGVGSDSIYMSDYIYVRPFQELTYYESFEQYSNFPTTDNWDVLNNSGAGFTVTTLAALTGNKSARLYNYNQDAGQVDQLISGPVDLSVVDTALNEIVTLSFRYSYRKRDASNNEWLRVKVKSACDGAWVTRKTIQGVFLSDEISSGVWVPQSDSDWVTVHVTNITDIFFTSNFQFMFHFTGDDGNNIYIDDINIYKGSPSDDIVAGITEIENDGIFTLYPNPADEELNVSFSLSNNENVEFIITDLQGKQVMNASVNGVMGKNLAVLDTQKLVEGAYFLHVVGDDYQITEKFIIVD